MLCVRLEQLVRYGTSALLIALGLATAVPACADTSLPPIGGGGGGAFAQRCPANRVLFGLEIATGDDVDSVRPICATALAADHVANDASEGPFHGGAGPTQRLTCPLGRPVVLGLYVAFEGRKTVIVNNIHLFCGRVSDTDQPLAVAADAAYDGPPIPPSTGIFVTYSVAGHDSQRCPSGQVAVGVNGHSGVWLDSVGLICGASPITTPPPPSPSASVEPAVCRSLRHAQEQASAANAATIATLKTLCARALPPPAPCRSLIEVIKSNGPAATVKTLDALCQRARKEQGVL